MIVKKQDISEIRPLTATDITIANLYGYKGYFIFMVDGGKKEFSSKFWDADIFKFATKKRLASDFIQSTIDGIIFENERKTHHNKTGERIQLSGISEEELIKNNVKYWKHGDTVYAVGYKDHISENRPLTLTKTDVQLHFVGSEEYLNELLNQNI